MWKDVQVTVAGKVFKANPSKVLALNRVLDKYFELIEWYLRFNSTSKKYLHDNGYEKTKQLFNINTALIQTARDKAIETLKSFEGNKEKGSVLRLKKISIRFDKRCYTFSKTTNTLTPYWLTLSLNGRARISLPLVFGERQRQRIESAFKGEWGFTTVEMIKRNGEWYAHLVLKRAVALEDEPETVISIDRGERNLAVAVAVSRDNPEKPMKGQFWSGGEIKRIRGLYGHIRRNLLRKKLLKKVKEIGQRENRLADQQLHIIANQIVEYAKRFPKPVIVMENLNGIRENFNKSRKLNRRLHSLPFRRLQMYVEYEANLECIAVRCLTKKETMYTSQTCHKCGHVTQVEGREFACPNCGLRYNRDLNACINIAHALMRGMGWGRSEPPEPADAEMAQSLL